MAGGCDYDTSGSPAGNSTRGGGCGVGGVGSSNPATNTKGGPGDLGLAVEVIGSASTVGDPIPGSRGGAQLSDGEDSMIGVAYCLSGRAYVVGDPEVPVPPAMT